MEYSTCHKCGRKIVTSFDQESIDKAGGISELQKAEEAKGYTLGYTHRHVGFVGNITTREIKPICSICSNEESKKRAAKRLKKQMKEVMPLIKKVYVCPVYHTGFGECSFKSDNKEEVINHIKEKHSGTDLERLTGIYDEY